MSQPSSPHGRDESSKDKGDNVDINVAKQSSPQEPSEPVTTSRALEPSGSSPSPLLNSSRAGSAPTSDTAMSEHSPIRTKEANITNTHPEADPTQSKSASSKSIEPSADVEMSDDHISSAPDSKSPVVASPIVAQQPQEQTNDEKLSSPPPVSPAASPDDEMKDTSPVLSTKTRGRDDEDDTVPTAKRAKTQITSTEHEPSANSQSLPSLGSTGGSKPTPPISAYLTEIMDKKHWDSEPITDAQIKFLAEQLRKAKKTNNGNWYREPVDPDKLNIPTYFTIVPKPMDLSTIESNLKAGIYTSTDQMMEDFDLMLKNSIAFNGTQHPVSQAGFDLKAYFIKLLAFLPGRDQVTFKKTPKIVAVTARTMPPRRGSRSKPTAPPPPVKASSPATAVSPTFALLPDGTPLIRRVSTTADRPKREIHRPPPRDLPYADSKPQKKKFALELRFARQAVNSLFKPQHADVAYPFLAPVDPVALGIPDYHQVIKKPMDFRTIKEKLGNNGYIRAQEVYTDSQLVFSNCFRYNREGTPVHAMGQALKTAFEAEWDKKETWLAHHAPVVVPEPPPSEEEESEEEEFEFQTEAERFEKMRLLQEEINKLNAENLRIMNLPTREGAKSKGRPKKSRPESKLKAKPKKAAPPPKKEAKPKKIPTFGLADKQQIASFIETLDPGCEAMANVINMIRNGMPNVTEEDDIEISVEDIPDHVLYDLQKFIHKQTGPPEPEAEEEEEEDDDSDYVPAKKSRSSGRGKKPTKPSQNPAKRKNKPLKAGEHERQIQEVTATLARFSQDGDSPSESQASPSQIFAPAVESSDDESESESEEE